MLRIVSMPRDYLICLGRNDVIKRFLLYGGTSGESIGHVELEENYVVEIERTHPEIQLSCLWRGTRGDQLLAFAFIVMPRLEERPRYKKDNMDEFIKRINALFPSREG